MAKDEGMGGYNLAGEPEVVVLAPAAAAAAAAPAAGLRVLEPPTLLLRLRRFESRRDDVRAEDEAVCVRKW